MSQQLTVTSGRLRQSLMGLEEIIGRGVAETIIENLNMKGISYAVNCEDIIYHRNEITDAFQQILGSEIAELLMKHLCKQCEELR